MALFTNGAWVRGVLAEKEVDAATRLILLYRTSGLSPQFIWGQTYFTVMHENTASLKRGLECS